MRLIDRIGERYDRLIVIGRAPNKSATDTNARWICRCDCGRQTVVYGQDLQRGKVRSCGCWNAEKRVKHGMSRTITYRTWKAMLQRCENPDNESYCNYGGRGIYVSEEWHSFEAFYADMGDKPPKMSLERIDNNGPYSKGNCKWATMKQQLNNRRINRSITAFGRTQTISQWAEETGLKWHTIRDRIDRHKWPVEKALKP